MIFPFTPSWLQMNGPQSKAIEEAAHNAVVQSIGPTLSYISEISVDTATDDHLTFLGVLAGLPRPKIVSINRNDIIFTDRYEHNTHNGFATLGQDDGGRFVDLEYGPSIEERSHLVDKSYYRALLKTWCESRAEVGSLALLDELCYALSQVDKPAVCPFYRFSFIEYGEVPVHRAPGDLFVDLGQVDFWNGSLQIYTIIKALADSCYAPVPQIFVSIGNKDMAATPLVDPEPHSWNGVDPVTILTDDITEGSTVYYTTDGTDPTEESSAWDGTPIPVAHSTELRVVAILPGWGHSEIGIYEYV